MKTKSWLWVAMAGWALTGCGGPMEPVPGAESERGTVLAQSYTTSTGEVMPNLITLPSKALPRLDSLWPSTASEQRYVLLVAYTQPADVTGYVPPPRFRAYGVDLATGMYVFAVDADRQTYLNSFNEAMFRTGSILVMTPPGFKFYGSCPAPKNLSRAMNHATALTEDPVCGTDPIVRSGNTNSGGDDWDADFSRLMTIVKGTSTYIASGQYPKIPGLGLAGVRAPDAEAR